MVGALALRRVMSNTSWRTFWRERDPTVHASRLASGSLVALNSSHQSLGAALVARIRQAWKGAAHAHRRGVEMSADRINVAARRVAFHKAPTLFDGVGTCRRSEQGPCSSLARIDPADVQVCGRCAGALTQRSRWHRGSFPVEEYRVPCAAGRMQCMYGTTLRVRCRKAR